jgi:hypothetical protein
MNNRPCNKQWEAMMLFMETIITSEYHFNVFLRDVLFAIEYTHEQKDDWLNVTPEKWKGVVAAVVKYVPDVSQHTAILKTIAGFFKCPCDV